MSIAKPFPDDVTALTVCRSTTTIPSRRALNAYDNRQMIPTAGTAVRHLDHLTCRELPTSAETYIRCCEKGVFQYRIAVRKEYKAVCIRHALLHLSNGRVQLGGLCHLVLNPPRRAHGFLVARFQLPCGTRGDGARQSNTGRMSKQFIRDTQVNQLTRNPRAKFRFSSFEFRLSLCLEAVHVGVN